MTIDEAIAKNRSYAKLANDRKKWLKSKEIIKMQKELSDYHSHIADWLEELKALREKDQHLIHLTQKEFDVGTQYTYNKAIDDFVKLAKEHDFKYRKYNITDCVIGFIEFFAEQLKAGGRNEVD